MATFLFEGRAVRGRCQNVIKCDDFHILYLLVMANTCLIVLDPEMPFTLPEMKGISGTDGENYKVIK